MGKRQKIVNQEIVIAVGRDSAPAVSVLTRFLGFFQVLHICLLRCGGELLSDLRTDAWKIDPSEYRRSFQDRDRKKGRAVLKPIGGLGYSGSTFFVSPDSKYLVKSLPRHFEHVFFKHDMLEPYVTHMANHPSLLVHITDFLMPAYNTLGSLTHFVPTHHLVMENILYGKPDNKDGEWEKYDLKPVEFFYPRRDLMPRNMVSEKTMARLVNMFEDKILLSRSQFSAFRTAIEGDTAFLERQNVVDYSLFLVRYPAVASNGVHTSSQVPDDDEVAPTSHASAADSWRHGITSVDGQWTYRAVLLDFMWSKHQLRAQAMSGAVKTFNVFAHQGEMSVTTTPADYRQAFLQMVDSIVEVADES